HDSCLFLMVVLPSLEPLFSSRTVFFFSSRRRHTRSYGDWSSDVCSSDLKPWTAHHRFLVPDATKWSMHRVVLLGRDLACSDHLRSEERRVGKECRSRWWPDP